MRTLLLAVFLLTTAASAQTSTSQPQTLSADPGWQKIQTLEHGRRIHLNLKSHNHLECIFAKADEGSVTCGGTLFPRDTIQSIKSVHHTRSAWVGFGTGYVAAIVVSSVAYSGSNSNTYLGSNRCNSSACILSVTIFDLAAVIVTPILFHIYDLTATTLYKAP